MKAKKILSTIVFAVMLVVSMGITAMADTAAEVARIGDATYATLADAFANAKGGDTIELLSDITVTETIRVTDQAVLNDITLGGNNHTITTDTSSTLLLFGDNANSKWCTGVKIKDLTIDGTAKYAIYLTGGTSSELTNVNVEGTYSYGIVFYGTHGGTVTNCNIVSAFTNGQDDNPLKLVNSTFGSLVANNSVAGEGAKVFLDENSKIDELSVGGNSTIMIDPDSLARVGSVTSEEGALVAEVNGVRYATLQVAVDAANDGDTVNVIADVADEAVTVTKNITLTSDTNDKATLNNVSVTIDGTTVELTVSNLKFTGSSYINANNGAALTVTNCEADVEPTKITGRAAFIVLGTGEPSHGLKLVVTDNTILSAQSSTDTFSAAIFGWRYLADGTTISGNTFGGNSDAERYTFIAVKTMNAMPNATFTLEKNTVYGTNKNWHFKAFDLYQNCSRDNTYTVISKANVINAELASTSNKSNAFYLEDNNDAGTNVILMDNGTTVNGEAITMSDIDASGLPSSYDKFYGINVTLDESGKIISGTFGVEPLAAYLADGYETVVNEDGTYVVQVDPYAETKKSLNKVIYKNNMTKSDNGEFRVGMYAGIDSLDYSKVGFKVFDGETEQQILQTDTKTVYTQINATNGSVTAEGLGVHRIFGIVVNFDQSWDDVLIHFQPYAVTKDGTEILGDKYNIPDIWTKETE